MQKMQKGAESRVPFALPSATKVHERNESRHGAQNPRLYGNDGKPQHPVLLFGTCRQEALPLKMFA